jgi:hypothetical protein
MINLQRFLSDERDFAMRNSFDHQDAAISAILIPNRLF